MATDNSSPSDSSRGSCPKAKLTGFLPDFVCDYLAKHARAKDLVKLKEDRSFLRFNDIDEISSLYRNYVYKEKNGKTLKSDLKCRRDNFLKMLVPFEKNKSLEKVGRGERYGKEYLEYEVKSSELWHLLTRSYSVKRNSRMRHENFRARHGETSSDTGLGMTQSDDLLHNEAHQNYRESGSMLSSEQSSDTRDVSQSDDQFVNETRENFGGSHTVLSSDLYSDTGVSQSDDQRIEENVMFLESQLFGVELNNHLHNTGVVSQSDDPLFDQANTSSESETFRPPPLSTAVDEVQLATITPDRCSTEGGSSIMIEAENVFQRGTYNVEFSYRGLSYGTCDASGDGTKYIKGLGKIPAASSQFDESISDQTNLSSENVTSQRPPRSPTAVNERIPKLSIVPKYCNIEGGDEFIVRADKDLREGRYKIQFGDYGICKALGSGSKHLDGCDNIPAARRRGTHSITVQVFDENETSIGGISFEYRDNKGNRCRRELVKNSSQDGSNSHNEPHQRKHKSSSNSMECTGSNKKFKSCPADMPMLMYLCDEMAKEGDEHFFSVLIKLGIMGDVLDNRSEYYKDFTETAREHGHNKLAETIATSSRELPCDRDMETLTIGKLLDAVQQERSLANSDPVYTSDKDDDSNSCSSGYNGDCDSEDLDDEKKSSNDVITQEPESPSEDQCCTNGNLKENENKTDAVLRSCFSHYDGDLNDEENSMNVVLIQEPKPVAIDVEKKEHIFEDEDYEETSSAERPLNADQEETVAGVDNTETDSELDGQCCTNGSLKENKDKTDAVLGNCNSDYDGDSRSLRMPFFLGLECNFFQRLRILVDWPGGFDLLTQLGTRRSPLMRAAESGSFQKVKQLIESGANVNVNEENLLSKTALHYAAERGSMEIVKYLVEHGADVNAKDDENKTALHYAAERGSMEIVKYLVEHDANVNAKDDENKTALHYATCSSLEIVKYLVQHGADVNKKDLQENKITLYHATTKLLLIKSFVDTQNVEDSVRRNDQIIKILELELKKSSKLGHKIKILKAMDNEKLTKVGLPLKCFAPDESLSIRTSPVRRSVCVGVMEDGSNVALTLRMMMVRPESEVAGSVKHLQEHGARMIKEILTGLEFLHDQGILRRDLNPSHVLVDVVGHMKLADFGMSRVLNKVGSPLKSSAPDESLSIRIGSVRRSAYVCVMEDGSEMAMRIMILLESEVAAGSIKHLQDHGPRMIEETITGQTLIQT